MHILTFVIVPGPESSAPGKARDLMHKAIPRYFDYYGLGGRFGERFYGPAAYDRPGDLGYVIAADQLPVPLTPPLIPYA